MGGGARSAAFCMLMSPKKMDARSARARTRGQNPLVHKYLQPEKSGGFKKSLLFVKSGGFSESLRFYKNQADLQNSCAFLEIRRIYEILAFLQKSARFTESLRLTKNQADLQNP
jgi:hypothetical protein